MKTKPKTKEVRVKAWAVFVDKKIENADCFVDGGCCCCEETKALAIYETKKEAEEMSYFSNHGNKYKIIQVLISLPPTKKVKSKKNKIK